MANPLESFKKLPAWGKAAVAAGGAGAAFLVYRAHSKAAASAATTAADTTAVDPATGFTSGSPQDEAALSSLQSGSAFPVTASSGGVTTTVGTTSGYGTNAAWAQAAEAGLAEVGFDSQTVATALGAYLAGQTLTADQAAIVFAATAEFGAPPVSPPPVTLSSSTGPAVSGNDTTTATGTTTATSATTPAKVTPAVSGGHVVSVSNNDAVVAWTGTGASQWQVRITGPGPINGHTATVGIPQASYSGLQAGHTYEVSVQPLVSGKAAGHSGTITFVTK